MGPVGKAEGRGMPTGAHGQANGTPPGHTCSWTLACGSLPRLQRLQQRTMQTCTARSCRACPGGGRSSGRAAHRQGAPPGDAASTALRPLRTQGRWVQEEYHLPREGHCAAESPF